MLIPKQPYPKIPPIGFFEPISVDARDMMTDVEYLLGILKKLNQMITQINSNSSFIEAYSGKIEEIETEIANLRTEMESFKNEVNTEIAEKFAMIEAQLKSEIALVLARANAYTDAKASQLEEQIRQISLGQIVLFDPTTGMMNDLQSVIDNIYGTSREEAITAAEYDALDLTATYYDSLDITAFNYDRYGKTILMNPA